MIGTSDCYGASNSSNFHSVSSFCGRFLAEIAIQLHHYQCDFSHKLDYIPLSISFVLRCLMSIYCYMTMVSALIWISLFSLGMMKIAMQLRLVNWQLSVWHLCLSLLALSLLTCYIYALGWAMSVRSSRLVVIQLKAISLRAVMAL